MTDKERAINHIRFGEAFSKVTNDENNRTIIRKSENIDTLPDCYLWEGNKFIGVDTYHNAIDFLFA